MLGLARAVGAALAAQRGHLFPWVPVAYGTGIGLYFLLPFEPSVAAACGALVLSVILGAMALRLRAEVAPLIWLVAAALLGGAVATARTAHVAGPVLGFRYYGPVEGRVIGIDRSASDAVRLTLDRVVLFRVDPADTPLKVRISLHGDQRWLVVRPGQRVAATAHLSAPGGPVEPGGFDFRRHTWFLGLGGVGYTRVPVLEMAPPEPGAGALFAARMALADRVRAGLPGDAGAFAAAVTTGDRSGMGQGVIDDLRASNLAHLLAISGLHMGLLAGFVFGSVRLGLAAVPWVALRAPIHKIAAVVALVAAAGYLALSGGSIATERAFVMVAVALVALLFDRRALSLRAVALAGLIVLTLRPEALLGPGFQMSFAATIALVAVFAALRSTGRSRWYAPLLAVVISSAVAGAATAPIGAAHFNQIARLGLIANLTSVPMMGVLVMPAAVVAACLMPFGAEGPALWVMGLGLEWILWVAEAVAARPEALDFVAAPPGWVLPVLSLGGLLLCLWQGRVRWAGALPVVVALWAWHGVDRPDVLVAEDGGLIGVMTAEGRALSRRRGAGFVAQVWLENDGDPVPQEVAADRWALVPEGLARHVTGKKRVADLTGCDGAALLVANARAPDLPDCRVMDAPALRATGAVSITFRPEGWKIDTVAAHAGTRPWSPAPRRDGRTRHKAEGADTEDLAAAE